MPKLNEVISTPDQLAEQLWSADFISDYEEDAFSTTDGQSRYKKAQSSNSVNYTNILKCQIKIKYANLGNYVKY